jgi:hypothetical protein
MNIDNIKLAIDHSQQLRLWICGNQPKLSYGDRIDLLVHKDFNEVVISNYINPDDLKDILEPLNTSKRNVLVSIPDMNVELPRGFIRNKTFLGLRYKGRERL